MNNNMLTAKNIEALNACSNDLAGYPAMISRSLETVDYALANAHMRTWIDGSEAGKSIEEALRKIEENLKNLCSDMNHIKVAVDAITSQSKSNSSQSM